MIAPQMLPATEAALGSTLAVAGVVTRLRRHTLPVSQVDAEGQE